MSSRGRASRAIDGAALGRVAATARTRPDSATAVSGFASRAVAALYPVVPAWVHWTGERSDGATAGMFYQLCYPPITAEGEIIGGAAAAERFWTRDRIFWAEKHARCAARARLHGHGVIAHSPELSDDAEFFAAAESGHGDFDGHWYSRDAIGAPEWAPA